MAQTIAALSTAPGGAIGIVRISGDAAESCLRALFTPVGSRDLQPRVLTYGVLTVHGPADGRLFPRTRDLHRGTYGRNPLSRLVGCPSGRLVRAL